ncbi:MAG: hypothetical protein K6B13_14255 [Prevotella sp.]|nr:hypothetical protein [Prevotella sp.]
MANAKSIGSVHFSPAFLVNNAVFVRYQKALFFDVAPFNFFEEVFAHHQQQVASVLQKEPLVVGHVLMVRVGDTFPQRAGGGITVCVIYGFAVVVSHQFAQFFLFQYQRRAPQGLQCHLRPQFFEVGTVFSLYLQRQVLGIFTDGLRALRGDLLNQTAKILGEQFLFLLFAALTNGYVLLHYSMMLWL